jgi:C_GCAxxG_C_C family probable redox protein
MFSIRPLKRESKSIIGVKKTTNMSLKSESAVTMIRSGYNCAQSVFAAFCEDCGIDRDTGLKTACGFGTGMARKQEVCGALAGGILVLGARYGRGEQEDRSAADLTYTKVRWLMDRFADLYGTLICRELLNGLDLTTEEGRRHFKEARLLETVCSGCVRDVVLILEEDLNGIRA